MILYYINNLYRNNSRIQNQEVKTTYGWCLFSTQRFGANCWGKKGSTAGVKPFCYQHNWFMDVHFPIKW